MATTTELKDREKELRDEATALVDKARIEGRELTEEESARFEEIRAQIDEVKRNRESLEQRLRTLSQKTTNTSTKTVTREIRGGFRLLDAISNIVNGRQMSPEYDAIMARGREQMMKSGQSFSGQIQVPVAPTEARTLDGIITATHNYTANTYNGGKEAVPTDTFDIVAGLRGQAVLAAAGATYLQGLVGNVEIPTYSGTTVGWGTEVGDAGNGTGTFGSVTLSPKRLTAYVDISKQFLIQTADAAENMLRTDIVAALTSEVEKALLADSQTSNAPTYLGSSVSHVTTAADWFGVIAALEGANYYGDFRAILSPSLKASLRGVKVTDNRLLYENGEVDGYPAFVSTNCESGLGFVGVWPELIVGQWGAVDIVVDPYTVAAAGKVRIVVNAYFDAAVRRAGAIKCIDYVAPTPGD